MSGKIRFVAVGAFLLVISLFLYFSIRFKYIERDLIDSRIRTTNQIVAEYHDMEKRAADEKKTLVNDDLAAFLKNTHARHRDVALLAITDARLTLRLSSKNDRFIRTTALFEAILKDFTQDKFNISKTSPFITRYYDERTDGATDQLKFYIFLNRIGERRLLVAYPYTFGDTILVRTVLEVCLVAVLVIIFTAALAVISGGRSSAWADKDDDGHTIDLGPGGGRAARGDGEASRESSNVVSDTISGYIHNLFGTIHETYGTDSVALYLYHATGKLVKTMELKGSAFLRINSVSFDTIDTDTEAGGELKSGATMVLDGGSRVMVPLLYNNTFLGTVSIVRRQGLRGSDISEIKSGMAGILKNIHDFIMFNDVMTDAATGLHSEIYFNLKYNEYLQQWKHRKKDFSLLLIGLFQHNEQAGEIERNNVIRLVAPTISGLVKKDGFLCRYDDYCAVILHDLNARKTASLAGEIRSSLAKYRLKIGADTVISIKPVIGMSSTDTPGAVDDMIAFALMSIRPA